MQGSAGKMPFNRYDLVLFVLRKQWRVPLPSQQDALAGPQRLGVLCTGTWRLGALP